MKVKYNIAILLIAGAFSTLASAAKPVALGCGTIVSMRESTQRPFPSELADMYGYKGQVGGSTGGQVAQVLGLIPGVGIAAAVVGDVVAGAASTAVRSKIDNARIAKEQDSTIYKNVSAVEVRLDEGEVINVPAYVVSGMRYKVGARLNVIVSPKYGALMLGARPVFGGASSVGDSDYKDNCRIDDAEVRKAMLDTVKNAVDESRIVDPKQRRVVDVPVLAAVEVPAVEAGEGIKNTELSSGNGAQ